MTKDPVCGMNVNERTAAQKATYQGQTYYFCSLDCKAAFEKEPGKYAGRQSEHGGHGH